MIEKGLEDKQKKESFGAQRKISTFLTGYSEGRALDLDFLKRVIISTGVSRK